MTDDWHERAPAVRESFADLRRRAHDLAIARKSRRADVVHLAAALLETDEVRRAVEACGAAVDEVVDLVDGTMDEQPRRRWWQLGGPPESRALLEIYDRALVHALSSEVDRVTPVALTVRLLSQEPPSLVAERLDAVGVEPLPLMRWEAHGAVADAPLPRGEGPAAVVIRNDPYTTMEAVVELLQAHFGCDPDEAEKLMRRVHERGRGTVRFRDWDEARRTATAARDEARRRGHPLELTVEPA
jgi:ATP-dependent Clp protease adapter protein ClpS